MPAGSAGSTEKETALGLDQVQAADVDDGSRGHSLLPEVGGVHPLGRSLPRRRYLTAGEWREISKVSLTILNQKAR